MISLLDVLPYGLPDENSDAIYLRGDADRFSDLLNWGDIERILETSCFDGPGSAAIGEALQLEPCHSRVCLIRGSKEVWRAPRRIVESDFARRLPGSTLRIEAIEEVHPPLRPLANELGRESLSVYLNAYAAWGTSRGLALHYDYTNILVLQLSGEKHWSVYRPTRKAVRGAESRAYKDAIQKAERGESDDRSELQRVYDGVYWEGTLSSGDVLFIPPGWFHSARPTGGPTLHLSCAFDAPPGRGGDFPRVILPDALRELRSFGVGPESGLG